MAKLTKKESAWFDEVNAALAAARRRENSVSTQLVILT